MQEDISGGCEGSDGGGGGGGGGGDSNGRGLMKPMVRLEIGVTRMQVRVPHIHIGDNLAQIKAVRLANVQIFRSNVWRPNRVLSTPQIDSICGVDRKNGHFYVYLHNIITKKSQF